MDNDISLSGLDPESAREFVLQHIIALKSLQKERLSVVADLELWSGRAALAAQKGREDLKEQALLRCRDISEKEAALAEEERKLAFDVSEMKRQLEVMKHQPVPTIDADLLLAQLEQVVGEADMTRTRFRELETDQALEELKRKKEAEDAEDVRE
ncbi:MAG TPA: hypothetical protein VMW73_06600 [Spirochaetia bacterium]|nr:hypothetical protein [Spirochaetia bacterium]